ncbi:MAG: methylmalonyl-CoA mutase family protein, partial [Kutzneria sp.]|nr:methylmalonyl-CoA mutase family protein [Kutzneria sp.]
MSGVAPLHKPAAPVRFITAASLFDGHDAAINIMRRILQAQGAEVIHLGHNRSVSEVVTAAIQEDVNGVAISAYQGGHVEYFSYLVDLLAERGAGHIKVFGGGGGVIVPDEIELLHAKGVARIFSPADGQRLGLAHMINSMVSACDYALADRAPASWDGLFAGEHGVLARAITAIEAGVLPRPARAAIAEAAAARTVPVLGITGTGGSGKSSLTDELIRRLRVDQQDKPRIAVLAVDPSRRRGGGALLGDRIRMNSIGESGGFDGGRVFFRSVATRRPGAEVPDGLADMIEACKAAGNDLVVVETPGIGQGDAAIVPFVDLALYVMTPEFGAASQLEKIDMLDFADVVAINKFERRGAEDARRDVARQLVRNREAFGASWQDMPVFGTSAATFNDDGVTALYQHLRAELVERGLPVSEGTLRAVAGKVSTSAATIVPASRSRYLSDIADTVRSYHRRTEEQVEAVRRHRQLVAASKALAAADKPTGDVDSLAAAAERQIDRDAADLLTDWPATVERYSGDEMVFTVRDKELRTQLTRETLSGNKVRRVSLPRYDDEGSLLRFLRSENLPGRFPFTAGVFPFKRDGEDPARMFAGEGDAFRTNRRFKYLSASASATRLSTAFDSVTLYGRDPDTPPDVYGK